MDGQISLFDKKTNFDVLMSCTTPEQFMKVYETKFGLGCRQMIAQKKDTDKEVWQKHCLQPEYRGENGCYRCKMEFWKKEYVD